MKRYIKIKVSNLLGGRSNLDKILKLNFDNSAFGSTGEEKLFKKHNNSPMTFGTLMQGGLDNIINLYKNNIDSELVNKNFIDLGSGDGRVPIWASMYGFKNSNGIELSTKRHNIALENLKKINKKNINFYNYDMFNHNINQYDLMYISSLCFSNELIEQLGIKLDNEAKQNSMIVSSKEIPLKKFKRIEPITIGQSWDNDSSGYVYIKN